MDQKRKLRVSVTGLVIANSWANDGRVRSVAIAARDESSTPIKPGSATSAKLLKCLNQMVTVEGVMEESAKGGSQLEVSLIEVLGEPRLEKWD